MHLLCLFEESKTLWYMKRKKLFYVKIKTGSSLDFTCVFCYNARSTRVISVSVVFNSFFETIRIHFHGVFVFKLSRLFIFLIINMRLIILNFLFWKVLFTSNADEKFHHVLYFSVQIIKNYFCLFVSYNYKKYLFCFCITVKLILFAFFIEFRLKMATKYCRNIAIPK